MYEKNENSIIPQKSKSDTLNIFLLLFLYMLQGIPRSLIRAMPLLFQNRNVSYDDQAIFSATALPFSCKLMWAPIIDCFYIHRIGQRKSWLVPSQFALGNYILINKGKNPKKISSWSLRAENENTVFCFFILGIFGDDWLGPENKSTIPKIPQMAIIFAVMSMLSATQDVAVDGWALTMLRRDNIGHAATCDYVGRHIGELIGLVLFTLLNSKKFCNEYLRSIPQSNGVLSFSHFCLFWSIIYFLSTTLILIFKKERRAYPRSVNIASRMTIGQSYKLLWKILKIKPLRLLCSIVLTGKIGFGVIEAVTPLKLIDLGVSNYKLVLICIPLLPIQAILPFLLKRYLIGEKCLNCHIHVIIYRCFTSALIGSFVFMSPGMQQGDHFPIYYYGLMFLLLGLDDMGNYAMGVSFTAFAAKISDAQYGGTYVTMLNTAHSLSVKYPEMLALGLMKFLTVQSCESRNFSTIQMESKPNIKTASAEIVRISNHTTFLSDFTSKETESLMTCTKILDGYFIEVIFGILFTILWLQFWAKKNLINLQKLNESSWHIRGKDNKNANDSML